LSDPWPQILASGWIESGGSVSTDALRLSRAVASSECEAEEDQSRDRAQDAELHAGFDVIEWLEPPAISGPGWQSPPS
jgi:hypothetical protein